jgi:hypothetical protein
MTRIAIIFALLAMIWAAAAVAIFAADNSLIAKCGEHHSTDTCFAAIGG